MAACKGLFHALCGMPTGKCDLSQGDWVPDHAPPVYNNETCRHIQATQDCLGNGRPDSHYLYWKWKPRGCEVLRSDAEAFLRTMRGQKMAFVGDSIARNQMQSLLCILNKVEKPTNTFHSSDDKTNHWFFPSYSFTLTIYWSSFLVKNSTYTIPDADNTFVQLDLDILDPAWVESMAGTDVIVISSGQWYFKAAVYREGGQFIGCHHCGAKAGLKQVGFFSAYRRAIRTVFRELLQSVPAFDGVAVFRTFAPDHFENGGWDTGGTCPRTVPGGVAITEMNWMMHEIETTELEKVRAEMGANRISLLDITELAQIRTDGHPGPYRNPYPYAKDAKEKFQIDCLHWCLPGPIDTWNEMLMETLQQQMQP